MRAPFIYCQRGSICLPSLFQNDGMKYRRIYLREECLFLAHYYQACRTRVQLFLAQDQDDISIWLVKYSVVALYTEETTVLLLTNKIGW